MKKPEPTKEKIVSEPLPYIILFGNTRRSLEEEVSNALENGWILLGSPFYGNDTFFQTVVRASVPVK